MKIYLCLFFAFFLVSCSTKANFDEAKNTQQALINSQNIKFNLHEDRFLITSTYLNPLKSLNLTLEENFLLGIYSSNPKNPIFIKEAILNGTKKNIQIKELNANDPFVKLSPISSRWSKFYLIKAPLVRAEKLNLTLKTDKNESILLSFQKFLLE